MQAMLNLAQKSYLYPLQITYPYILPKKCGVDGKLPPHCIVIVCN